MAVGVYEDTAVETPFLIPNETAAVKLVKITSQKAYAKVMSVQTPSKHRVEPVCDIFGKCGGCQLQHVSYPEQLNAKKQLITAALQSFKLDYPELNVIGCEPPLHYRNKAQFEINQTEDGDTIIGLSAPRSQRIIDCNHCDIQHPLTNLVLTLVKTYLNQSPLPLTHLVTRIGNQSTELMVALVAQEPEVMGIEDLVSQLKTIPELKSVYLSHNTNPEWTVLGESETLLWGNETITESIGDLKLSLSLRSFFQVNTVQTPTLWNNILTLGSFKKTDTVWDLYSGTGALSIYIARHTKQVIGIESHPESIKNAEENAQINKQDNLTFIQGDVETKLQTITGPCDVMIVDPPRKGLSPTVIQSVLNKSPEKIIYVSCSPETLARDLQLFCNDTYAITAIQGIDMFPQTYHVETLVMLTKKKI